MAVRPLQLANANQLTEQLWIGGDLDNFNPVRALQQLQELDEVGITDIVDVRLEWSDEALVEEAAPHINYYWLGVDDRGQRIPDDWFDIGTDHVLTQLNRGGKVLTHCHMGINRGPTMGFAVLLAQGWDPIEALDLIRERRPIAFVGYAEDAVDWWLRKQGATRGERAMARRRLEQWRIDNHLDVANIIRIVRSQEGA